MNPEDFPTTDATVPELTPAALKRRLDDGERVTILDARAPDTFAEWHLEAPIAEVVNVPYFEFLDAVDGSLDETLLDRVPEAEPLVVLCAKGGASEFVAGTLAEAGRSVVHVVDGMRGWARLYERDEVTDYDGPGTVYQYRRPSSGCLGYLLVADGEAAVIDPLRAFTDRYLADAAALDAELVYALDTHVHADHVSGVRELVREGVTGVLPTAAVDRGVTYADRVETVADGDTLAVGTAEIDVLHTPGHTSGMTSYLLGDSVLTTGDGLFVESVARPDLEAGADGAADAARQLHETLRDRVLALDDDTVIGGAHYGDGAEPAADGTYTAPLGEVVDRMPVLTADEEAFVDTVMTDMPPRPANYEEIVATNLGRETADDDEAFKLELGPNNCAASDAAMTSD
ncbi:MBL fold metallo-hydrolase [Halobaculum sp. MBLA0147]|uniref:MBL fold metallo-hydrolase n=1 Tax=Halobaculum sp. MBLA0147 TaxID=3079934 RepID=UPI003524E80D